MPSFIRLAARLLSAIACLSIADTALAQLPQARLYAAFPAGGQAGTTFDFSLTSSADLDDVSRLIFTHPGITAVAKTQVVDGETELLLNQFTVTIAPDVPPGVYEVRAVGLYGQSNPRTFTVGSQPEFLEVEPNNTVEQATAYELDRVCNGRINGATDVDWFKFKGTAGQRIVLLCSAKRIDSRLDATLELFGPNGRRLALGRNNWRRDALIDATLPVDGDYTLKLYDFVYGGGEEYRYRLRIGLAPHIAYAWPPAGVPGTTQSFALYGRNLPGGVPSDVEIGGRKLDRLDVSIPVPADPAAHDPRDLPEPYAAFADGFAYALPSPHGPSEPIVLGYSHSPVVVEVEPNNLPAQVQKLTAPFEFAGQFQSRSDVDLVQFEAKAGDVYWIEAIGQRLGAGADPYLIIDQVVVNDKGEETLKRIANPDDDPANPLPVVFETLSDDPVHRLAVPADGVYRIAARDRYAASRGSPGLVYRLMVRRESPDFRVAAVPSIPTQPNVRQPSPWSIGLRKGDQFDLAVLLRRIDGFAGAVKVSAEGLPPGVTCPEIVIGPTQSAGTLVFAAAEDAAPASGSVRVIAKATIDDPAAAGAATAAQAAVKAAGDEFAKAQQAAAKPIADFQQAEAALIQAKAELASNAADEALQKKAAAAEAAVAAVKPAFDQASAARGAAEAKFAATKAAASEAEANRVAKSREAVRPARAGTILWPGQQNQPSPARLAQTLEISVLDELAPFQILHDVARVEVNHNRQVLVPVKVVRRNGFDQPVNLTFAGMPPNVQVENKPVAKEKSDEVYRVFVPPNAPVGTYVAYLSGQAQASYRRNPKRVDKAKAGVERATAALNTSQEALNKATTAKDELTKAAQAAAALKKEKLEAKVAAMRKHAAAKTAEQTAAKAVAEAKDDAQRAERDAAHKMAVEAMNVAQAEFTAAEAASTEADAKAVEAEAARVRAEATLKQATEAQKAATTAKQAADKRLQDAENAAKPQNINFLPPSPAIVLTIKAAPLTASAAPANGGQLKRGETLEVKVNVNRINGFVGPVTAQLPLPPSVMGLSADPLVIPADKKDGVLVIRAAADATEGQLANLVVRFAAEFEGEALVDAPLAVKVNP